VADESVSQTVLLRRPLSAQSSSVFHYAIRGLLEKYPTFGREKETGLLGALDT